MDPEVIVKPTKGQIDDLLEKEVRITERDERVLVTTLTKKMAEDLTDYMAERGHQGQYLHSDVDTLRRVELRELRMEQFDVLVGINLLREASTSPKCRWLPFSTPTSRASCVPRPPLFRRLGAPPEMCRPGTHVRRLDYAEHARGDGRNQSSS